MDKEKRFFNNNVSIRKEGQIIKISGYALKFNSLSEDLGGFREQIHPKALDGTDLSDVVALFNHDNNHVLGRTPMTLKLSIDTLGLRYEIHPPKHAVNLIELIERGDIRGSSFQFRVSPDGDFWEYESALGIEIRTIKKIAKIYDISPVTFPAYNSSTTDVALRSLDEYKNLETRLLPNDSLDLYFRKLNIIINRNCAATGTRI